VNPRERAFTILGRIETENLFAAPLVDSLGGDERDRRFIRTLVFGVLRWRSRLDYVIEQLAGRRVAMLDRSTRILLRLGIYQLLFSDVPPHAAVFETVSLAARKSARAKGLINAVLRRAAATDLNAMIPSGNDVAALAIRWAHPEWLLRRWATRFGRERAEAIAKANQELSYSDLLINERRMPREEALALLRERGVEFDVSTFLPAFVRLRSSAAPVAPEIGKGIFYPMDEASALVTTLIDPASQRVLDFTAAPGGKSLLMTLQGHDVVSHDLSLARLELLTRSAVAVTEQRPRIVVGDGTRPPFRQRFDAVLLDAPCTATGTLRRNPELKWRLEATAPAELATLQRTLLHRALDLAERECVYATCSLEEEENENVIAAVLQERSDFRLVAVAADSVLARFASGTTVHLTPENGCDGFTMHKLVRIVN
jgi:16S rRNA (cytosine967-C5)-methyltransferase